MRLILSEYYIIKSCDIMVEEDEKMKEEYYKKLKTAFPNDYKKLYNIPDLCFITNVKKTICRECKELAPFISISDDEYFCTNCGYYENSNNKKVINHIESYVYKKNKNKQKQQQLYNKWHTNSGRMNMQ